MTQPSEDHISVADVRPRFKVETPYSIDELLEKIKSGLSAKNATCEGNVIHGHATVFLPKDKQHYWSPQLTLNLEETESGSILRGMYAPRPEVWTMFVLFYSIIGFAALVISVVGYSQWSLGNSATILWFVPVLGAIFLTLYLVSYSGKKMGYNQMVTLHNFVESRQLLK